MKKINEFKAPLSKVKQVKGWKGLDIFCIICKTIVPLKGNRQLAQCTNPICESEIADLWVVEMVEIKSLKRKGSHHKGLGR
jgi:hypothetical protein